MDSESSSAVEQDNQENQLVELVYQMRIKQREHFRDRDPATLIESKAAERAVDDLVDQLRGQGRLF